GEAGGARGGQAEGMVTQAAGSFSSGVTRPLRSNNRDRSTCSSDSLCASRCSGKGGEGGYRLYDTVFVFKEFRLAYKCTGEYNTFK
ncbi:Mitogen-activated protein kinase 17, partial [Dissostichus eleginoides]